MKKVLLFIAALLALASCNHSKDDSPAPVAPVAFQITTDSVQVNPYGYAPLSALVSFSSPVAGKTFIRVRGKHGKLTNVEHTFDDMGLQHQIPVIGLYANFSNTVDIRVVSPEGDTLAASSLTIQTGDLPPNLPTSISATPVDESKVTPGLILVSNYSTVGTSSPYTPFFLDAYGDIRWVLDYRTHPQLNTLNYEDGVSRLRNGNFFFGDSNTSAIYEVDLLGNVINHWGLSGYQFHHEVSEKPNGNFLLTATKPGSTYLNGNPTVEDFVLEIDRQSGQLTTIWDLKQSLDETRTSLTAADGLQPATDWFHGNAVLYDSTDNTIVVSGRTQGVVKLDNNNEIKWIMAPHTGWNTNRRDENLNQFLLTPLDAGGNLITDTGVIAGTAIANDFEWNWYQHNITHLPNGDWMMFDNGAVREFNGAAPRYSRVVTYTIDPQKRTVRQTGAYGKERGADTYSSIVSSAQLLPQTNHVLFGPGSQVPNATGKGGKVIEVDWATKQVVSEISISSANGWGFHRAKKLSAYP